MLKNASAKPAQDKMPGTPIKNETVPLAKAVKRSFDQFALARPKAHEVIRDVECLTAQEDVLLKADEEIKDLDALHDPDLYNSQPIKETKEQPSAVAPERPQCRTTHKKKRRLDHESLHPQDLTANFISLP